MLQFHGCSAGLAQIQFGDHAVPTNGAGSVFHKPVKDAVLMELMRTMPTPDDLFSLLVFAETNGTHIFVCFRQIFRSSIVACIVCALLVQITGFLGFGQLKGDSFRLGILSFDVGLDRLFVGLVWNAAGWR